MTEETWSQRVVRTYREQGTLRAAAVVLGVSHQTVANVLERAEQPEAVAGKREAGMRRRELEARHFDVTSDAAFDAWCVRMREARGWSLYECARRLGASENSVSKWRQRGAPRYVGLACAALEAEMEVIR